MAEPYWLHWEGTRWIEVYGLPLGLTHDEVCERIADAIAKSIEMERYAKKAEQN